MARPHFRKHDGGRAAAGYKGETRDCVCRAIAIATELPYQTIYDLINEFAEYEKPSKRRKGKSNARTGVHKVTTHAIMQHLGWKWTATMGIGTGCKVHLDPKELPQGRIVCQVSRHLVAVVDGEIYDSHDSSRNGKRCVYGYWRKG